MATILQWDGKAEALAAAATAPRATLRLRPELSRDGDSTENLLIEGDNLTVLKLLAPQYAAQIAVIYIDPPYNTGHDLAYSDTFATAGGDRHAVWLSMMAPRLTVARTLLREDGVLFISVDETEHSHLTLLCREIFGEHNVETMIWQKVGDGNAAAGRMKVTRRFRREHEYIVVCYRARDSVSFAKYAALPRYKHEYGNPDHDPRGPYKGGNISRTEALSRAQGKNFYTVTSPDGKKSYSRQWHVDEQEFQALDRDGRIYWGKSDHGVPQRKIFLGEEKPQTPVSVIRGQGSASSANREIRRLFGALIFPHSKPVELIQYLLRLHPDGDGAVLDFFAGSGTTAQAVMAQNAKDGGHRRFILVQQREQCRAGSAAAAAGYDDICAILRARVGKICDEQKEAMGLLCGELDLGFKLLELKQEIDEGEMNDGIGTQSAPAQEQHL